MPHERRTNPREVVNRPAKLREGEAAAVRACMIRDFSESGVRLYIPGGLTSDQFTLIDRAPLSCRVVWRLGELIGARFDTELPDQSVS
ncbi:MAG TPA: PilZ domain-containing protein [Xanthobacteraceae bacterium]|nr:PilZ domain-containing protein [Xanthobacteraceae bacterium]